jgi:alanyl-tRNA synthetase
MLKKIADITHSKNIHATSARVIADHIRSCSFLIVDGVLPSNEGRGYVLRRIIRRAIRHGNKLGIQGAFFYQLVPTLVQEMGAAYPELKKAEAHVEKVLKKEEEQFAKTLEQGLKILEDAIKSLKTKTLSGDLIFKLYDTYGFPVDLTADIARERDLQLDMGGFESAMEGQRQQSQAASKFGTDYNQRIVTDATTDFTGYETLMTEAMIVTILKDNTPVNQLSQGETGIIILDRTPFYAESGGQVGDTGTLQNKDAVFQVVDTKKATAAHLHHGSVTKGILHVGDKLSTQVDADRRKAIQLNHSATHLLQAALQKVLGSHVQQKGSLVAAERLRLDFTHSAPLTLEECRHIEFVVNQKIREHIPGKLEMMSIEDAKASGAMALFGEKYGDVVRVLSFGDFSKELCGGTHVNNTSDIGLFKIIAETGVAGGVRRLEAVTGEYALAYLDEANQQIEALVQAFKVPRNTVESRVLQLMAEQRELEKTVAKLQSEIALAAGDKLIHSAEMIHGVKVIVASLHNIDASALRELTEQLKTKLHSGIILLAVSNADKVSLIAGVTKDLTDKIKAGDLVNQAAMILGGKGGGRPDLAQAGASNAEKLPEALLTAKVWIEQVLH